MLVSSPEQEIKSLVVERTASKPGTPAFTGEVAYGIYRVLILLGSLKFESVTGAHFNPRTHGCRQGDALDIFTLCARRTSLMDCIHERSKVLIKLIGLKRNLA